jgi:MSHA biogenesis protein MshJ
MNKVKELQDKIDNLSLRERGAVFFCTLIVMFFVWDSFLMQPLQIKQKRIDSQLQLKKAEQFALNVQLQKFTVNNDSDPDKADKEKLQSLKSQLVAIEKQLQETTKQLIAPKDMAKMLETVLLEIRGLELVEVKGLGGEPIIKSKPAEVAVEDAKQDTVKPKPVGVIDNAYKHGLKIVFEGDYMSTLAYVQALESLGYGFFWENLELNVKEYPDSTVTITVFTLSLDENWIGV